jgi:hypothetical protein
MNTQVTPLKLNLDRKCVQNGFPPFKICDFKKTEKKIKGKEKRRAGEQ